MWIFAAGPEKCTVKHKTKTSIQLIQNRLITLIRIFTVTLVQVIYLIVVCYHSSYGTDCASKCDCMTEEPCDHVTGECFCPPGYTGDQCDKGTAISIDGGDLKKTPSCCDLPKYYSILYTCSV